MRVLVLILMSEGYPYDQFRAIWRTYMKSHPNVDCYFYMAKPNLFTEYLLDNDTLWIRLPEKHAFLFEKTIRAFRYFLNIRPNMYSFVFRPNASALLNLNHYYELCKTFPKEKFCSAPILRRGEVIEHPVVEAPSGCGYTLSIDVVNRFAREQGLRNVLIDDISVGYYLQEWGIPITPARVYALENRDYTPEELADILSTNYHFRFRNDSHRDWDISAMKMIADTIYNKK
jgi:hypothetical protein